MSDFFALAHSQRAYRELRPDPVSPDLIARILDAAVCAPSAENRQPWAFVVVTDPDVRAGLARVATRLWEAAGREFSRPNLPPKMFEEVDRWATGGLAAAPVHIVVCGDTERIDAGQLASSVFPAVQNILLGAIALGLGSLLSTLAVVDRRPVAELLDLPDHIVPVALVPLGWPARPLGPPRREPAADRTFFDRWGRQAP